jgi:flagellar hook-associated protein 2
MSISSSISPGASSFNIDGIVSGMNTTSIITKLMGLQKAPLLALQKQQTAITARDAAYQDIAAKIVSFRGAVSNLILSSSVNAKLATSSVPAIATAAATSSAINGSFSLNVINLATATAATSNATLGNAANMAPATLLTGAGLAIAPTAGTFTVNGQAVTVVAGDTWSSLQAKFTALTGPAVTLNLGTNSVSLTSASPVQLGAPSDTSNVLTATRLLGAPQTLAGATYTTASNQLLGAAVINNPLSTAGLNVAGGIAASGAFTVNGVSISWANTDSISGVLSRINASAAGVTATYDPTKDKVVLTNTSTGAQNISLVDTTGNFLGAMKLIGATQTYGSAAQYTTTQNGVVSAAQFSNSNTITGVVPGVNATLLSTGTTSINVTQDTTTATTNMQAFVTQFNTITDLLDSYTKYDPNTKTAAVLMGDPTITGLANSIRAMASQAATVPAGSAYSTLASIGVSTGAFGSAVGSTKHLVLDSAKLSTALQANPQGVLQVISGLSGTTSSTGDATNPWISSVSGTPYGQVYSGTYKIKFTPGTNTLSAVFTPTNGAPQPALVGTAVAGATNTTLIPGLSIVARNPLPAGAGTDTITYTVATRGIFQTLNAYLNKATTGASGIFGSAHTVATSTQNALTSQIADQTRLINKRQIFLQAQFTAMEVSLGKLNSQSSSLASSLNALVSSRR